MFGFVSPLVMNINTKVFLPTSMKYVRRLANKNETDYFDIDICRREKLECEYINSKKNLVFLRPV